MLDNLTFPQETVIDIQHTIEVLEKCLNEANPQDEEMAELVELAHRRQLSLSQIRDEMIEYKNKINKLKKLAEQDEILLLSFVKLHFIIKEMFQRYGDILLNQYIGKSFKKNHHKSLKKIVKQYVNIYKESKKDADTDNNYKEDFYIIAETIKHVIELFVKFGLQVNAFTEEEVNAMHLGDITPQASETVLTFLASRKKWDQVYKNLA